MKEQKTVSVEILGAGVLQAEGSASPVPTEPYDGTSFTTYQGRMQVIVRSGRKEGGIRIVLSAEGLEKQTVLVKAKRYTLGTDERLTLLFSVYCGGHAVEILKLAIKMCAALQTD